MRGSLRELAVTDYRLLDIACPGCGGLDAKCPVCEGAGYVCPVCTGEPRKLKHKREDGSIFLLPCMTCGYDSTEGWEYSTEKELTAVESYIQQWVEGRASSRAVKRQKENERIRAETLERQQRETRRWRAG